VSANATDNIGVAGVQFKLDGANLGAEDTTAPYTVSWDTTSVTNAGHTLTAVARDAAGNITTSAPISVTVSNIIVPTSGLVGHWTFDEGSGSTAADSSGNGNAGTVSGATWTTGKFNGALSFNGGTAMVTVPDSASLDSTSAVTVSAWIRPTSWPNNYGDAIVNKEGNYALRSGDNAATQFDMLWWNGSMIRSVRTTPPSTGAWHHVVGIANGNDASALYVDGVLVASSPANWFGSTRTLSNPLYIGGSQGDPGFSGVIDDVRIYNRALSASEVSDLYAAGGTTPPPPPPPPPPPTSTCRLRRTPSAPSSVACNDQPQSVNDVPNDGGMGGNCPGRPARRIDGRHLSTIPFVQEQSL
jgi:hypothetical protein